MRLSTVRFLIPISIGAGLAASCSANPSSSAAELLSEPPAIEGAEFSDIVKNTTEITNDPTGFGIILICGKRIAKSHLVASRDNGENDDWAEDSALVDSLFEIVKDPVGNIDAIYEDRPGEFKSSLQAGKQVLYFENRIAKDDFSLIISDPNDCFAASSETHNIVKTPSGRFLDSLTHNIHVNDIFEMRRVVAVKSRYSKYAQRPDSSANQSPGQSQ